MSNTLQLFAITASALPGVLTITQTEIPNELRQDGEKRNAYFIGPFMSREIIHHCFFNSLFLNSKPHLKVISNYLSNSEGSLSMKGSTIRTLGFYDFWEVTRA